MADFETLKRHVSLRGTVMTILTVAVAGLAIATLRYQPSAPDERSIYSPTSTTAPAGTWLAATPADETPASTTAPLPPSSTEPTPVPVETFVPTEGPSPTQTPTTSAPPMSSSTFTSRRDTNPTELSNGGRRFGTVQQ
jgi:hypothetical protein